MDRVANTRTGHDSPHQCPPGLLADSALLRARQIHVEGAREPADVIARAVAIKAWLKPHFDKPESGTPFCQALEALDFAIEDRKSPLHHEGRTVESVLARADVWLAALAKWRSR